MSSEPSDGHFETVVGLEVHVQLNTVSKAFCGDATTFGAEPNTQISPISLGHPGTLPRLNAAHLEAALRLGLALGSRLSDRHYFDRKHYFYADLPKGYQITQDAQPVCVGGELPIRIGESWKTIRIHHLHIEEDAGKSLHDQSDTHTLIDLNRAGVPLLEVVTEPDLRSPEEVDAFMQAMRQLVRYLDISDGNMQEGSMRCDVNISVRPRGSDRLGNRCEVKNVNSMRYARRAIEFEVDRQIRLIRAGETIQQQTLQFDPASGTTSPLREKEDAHDYRYFPEPDLPPIRLRTSFLQELQQTMPPLPWELHERLRREFALSPYDATLLTEDRAVAGYFFEVASHTTHYKEIANLIINKQVNKVPVAPKQLSSLIELVAAGTLNKSIAYSTLLTACMEQPTVPPEQLARELDLLQQQDDDALRAHCDAIVRAHPEKVAAYRKGKSGLLGFFMGELMKQTKGKVNPKEASALLRGMLEQGE